ncbi:MAG: hypothetical protein NT062_04295 [Proteobacteria bacterium]|nr:hypothetical protein [Pseudomonadota bacterium]
MKITGVIRRSDLEGGLWILEAASGDKYQLSGKLDGVRDGLAAEVDGKVDRNVMGFGMAGAAFDVKSIKAV